MYPRSRARRPHILILLALAFGAVATCQQSPLPDNPQPQSTIPAPRTARLPDSTGGWRQKYGKNHILWVIPNFRADEESEEISPLTPHEKYKVALDDSFDFSAFLVAGVFAGSSMAQRQYPSFGNGAEGYAKYFGGAFADQAVGNFMTEAVLPIALRQDPRYFVRGHGSFFNRTGYAISREVITRSDSGTSQFNTSEIAGNLVAAGASNIYYPDRSVGNTMTKWGQQIGLDAFFNVLKEFWPDVRQKVFHQ